jgi:branched-chain amino acid transport system substrate-binding protein
MGHRSFSLPTVTAAVAAAVVVCVGLTAAAASAAHRSGSAGTITLGTISILSGPSAVIGQDDLRGATFMMARWNKRGGVLGKQIKLIAADDANNPSLAVPAAAKLIQDDHVVGIVGPVNSVSGISIQKLQEDAHVPAVAYQSGAEALTAAHSQWVFRSCPTLNASFGALAQFEIQKLHKKRLAFIGWDLAAGSSALAGTKAIADRFGQAQLVYSKQLPLTTQDFSGVIDDVKAKDPDVVLIGAPMPFAGVLAKQIRESGWNVSIGASGDFVTTDFGQFLGNAVNGIYMTDNAHWKASMLRKVGRAFVKAWIAKYHRPPDANELVGADAMGTMLNGIQKAGSTDGDKIQQTLHRVGYNGVRFYARYDANGNIKHTPIPAVVWRKGQVQLVLKDVFPVTHKK